jgi:hypothetical protein
VNQRTRQTASERPGRRQRRGYSLLTSMIFILLLMIMGSSLFAMANAASRLALRRRQGAQALHLAIGVVDDAIAAYEASGSFSTFSNRALGAGTVTVTVTTPSGQPDRRTITGTAAVTDRGLTITRSVRATVEMADVPPVFYNALASKTSFGINGNVTVRSTPASNAGHVHSNGNVSLSGSAMDIYGRVQASGTVSYSGSPSVSGGMHSGVAPMAFPEIDSAFKEQALVNGSQTPGSGTLAVNNSATLVQGKINGSLSVGNNGCRVSGVVWVTGSVTVTGPIGGTGTIVCDGTMSLDGRFTIVASADVSNVLYVTTSTSSTAVDLGGNRTFKGLIYAPYGGVRLHGTPDLIGGIMADTVTLSGNPTVTKWTAFDSSPPPMPKLFQVKGWEEL